MGKGWGDRGRSPSPHIFATERWTLTLQERLPQAYLSEKRAMEVAGRIALVTRSNVEIDHQRLSPSGDWVSAD